MEGIKQVLFDLGGVLYHIDYTLSKKAFESLGIDDFDEHFSQQQQNGIDAWVLQQNLDITITVVYHTAMHSAKP